MNGIRRLCNLYALFVNRFWRIAMCFSTRVSEFCEWMMQTMPSNAYESKIEIKGLINQSCQYIIILFVLDLPKEL